MEKFETQLTELKKEIERASNILIFLPSRADIDKLASALALMLILQESGKSVWVVTEDTLRVSHGNLYGVGEVKNSLPKPDSGNLILTLEGVVDSEGKVPALEKLDWYPEGNNLNLVFHIVSGQRFEPTNIKSSYSGGEISLMFMVGVSNISEIGSLFQQNIAQLAGIPIINIDNDSSNNSFGKINILDSKYPSLSEMIAQIIPKLGFNLTADPAANFIAGIYDATSSLTSNASADTFTAIAQLLQAGGKLPVFQNHQKQQQIQQQPKQQPKPQVQPQPQPQPQSQSQPQLSSSKPQPSSGFDLSKIFPTEETPTEEFTSTTSSFEGTSPAPDWLTPKIYKGGGS